MNSKSIALKIIELEKADSDLRATLVRNNQLNEGYHEEMRQLHDNNATILAVIIKAIGYPTIDKVGKQANEAAFIVIQHAIAKPSFMKKCLKLIKNVAHENNVNPKHLAYLRDRIASFENRPQLYGTQFDWDQDGKLSPNRYDDLAKVNLRRKEIGLNTLEEQIETIRKQAQNDRQIAPINFEKRKENIENWKREVGWIT